MSESFWQEQGTKFLEIADVKNAGTARGEFMMTACGLDISYDEQIERGQRNPTLGVMQGLASVLGAKLSDY